MQVIILELSYFASKKALKLTEIDQGQNDLQYEYDYVAFGPLQLA